MRKKRYDKINPALIDQSCEELRKEFPAKLVTLFVEMHDSDYEEKAYNKYKKEMIIFLKDKAEDKIEQGKLIVRLTKATFDLVKEEKAQNAKKKSETKVKIKTKKAA